MKIRVLLADDHTIVRQGLVSLLDDSGECEVVAQAADGLEAVELALETRPDIAVLDLSMPRLGGLEAARRIHKAAPAIRLLVLTVHEEVEYVLPIVKAGVSGYLVKQTAAAELLSAIRALHQGRTFFGPEASQALAEQYLHPEAAVEDPYRNLTNREREVFHLIIEGKTTKQIAQDLNLSAKTVENHRFRVMEKLNVHSIAELVRYAAHKGLLD